jgi:serine/threonine-protein kinase
MATVHRAGWRGIEGFEKVVALKRLLPHMAEDDALVSSFVREAKLTSLLRHSRIAQTYNLGKVDETYFIAMEYVEGTNLNKILHRANKLGAPVPLEVVFSILGELCDGLNYAHTRRDNEGEALGLIHRDVSPSNVLVETKSGHVKLIDFGIAKMQSREHLTEAGVIKGKYGYMSPETVLGHPLDARSDVFSLGIVAHELLTLRRLFRGKTQLETLTQVRNAEVIPPSTYCPTCPPGLEDVVMQALSLDPNDRWPSMAAMRDALAAAAANERIASSALHVQRWVDSIFRSDDEETVVQAPFVVFDADPETEKNLVPRVTFRAPSSPPVSAIAEVVLDELTPAPAPKPPRHQAQVLGRDDPTAPVVAPHFEPRRAPGIRPKAIAISALLAAAVFTALLLSQW